MKLIGIKKAEYINNYLLSLEFSDNKKAVVDLKTHLNKPIFKPLEDVNYFKDFKLNGWTIEWNNGADFSPEFLYEIAKV